jgi:hypothetical protein
MSLAQADPPAYQVPPIDEDLIRMNCTAFTSPTLIQRSPTIKTDMKTRLKPPIFNLKSFIIASFLKEKI